MSEKLRHALLAICFTAFGTARREIVFASCTSQEPNFHTWSSMSSSLLLD
jgi:hypothetical protein